MDFSLDDEWISLDDMLNNHIMGQKRTGRSKQLLQMGRTRVWKGPYSKSDKVDALMNRSEWLAYWKTPLIVHPLTIIDSTDGQFVSFPNVDRTMDDVNKIKWTWNKESFTDWKYRVMERRSLLKLNNAVADNSWIYQTYGRDMLLALIHLWLLETGDTGLANMMADVEQRKVYIIDYDETRNSPITNNVFYFSKPAGKVHRWYENIGGYYRSVAQEVEDMLNDSNNEIYFERIKEAVDGLRRFAPDVTPDTAVPKETISKQPPIVRIFRFRRKQMQAIPREPAMKESVKKDVVTVQNPGQMQWSGPFGGSTTYSGYPLDEIKSGLQKYIRRGMTEEALQCAIEMWRMAEVGGKSAQSNMYNRLAIIAAEDVGLADTDLVMHVIDHVINRVHTNIDRSPERLCALVQKLVEAKKTRLMSHLWRTFAVKEGKECARSHKLVVDDDQIEVEGLDRYFLPSDSKELIPLAKMFHLRLSERNYLCIGWAAKYIDLSKGCKVKARRRRTNPVIILWEMMREFLPDPCVDILSKAYFTLSEKRPPLMMAISWILFHSDPIYRNIEDELTKNTDIWKSSEYLAVLLEGKYKLTLHDYVIDTHTKRGSLMGRNRKNFVQEGASIENENLRFHVPIFEEIYRNS